jgi:hypothetical protein
LPVWQILYDGGVDVILNTTTTTNVSIRNAARRRDSKWND